MTTVCLTFDFDALAIWLSTFKQTSPTPLSRGEYGARVGMPRVLALLQQHGVAATFFVPAHTARSFPQLVRSIVEQGHEVACHGLIHESPVGLSLEDERTRLRQSLAVLHEITGVQPLGYRSPAWDLSENTIALLQDHGLLYDSSLMTDDFHPFYARTQDVLSDESFCPGPDSAVLEFPVAWELDDFPYFQFLTRPLYGGLRSVDEVYRSWAAEFDCAHAEDGVFTLTCHPEIIGRGPRIQMLGRLIAHMQAAQAQFSTLAYVAQTYQPGQQTTLRGISP